MPRWKEAGYRIICRIWFQSCNRNHIYTYSKTSSSIYIFGFQKISYSWKNTKYSDIVWGFNFILYVFPVFSTVRMTTFIARKKTIIFRVFFFFLKSKMINQPGYDSSLPNFLPCLFHIKQGWQGLGEPPRLEVAALLCEMKRLFYSSSRICKRKTDPWWLVWKH